MHHVSFLLLPLAVAAIGRGVSQPSMLSMVSHASTARNRGAVMGTYQSSASLGRVIGPLIAGSLYDYRHPAPFLFASSVLVIVFFLALALPSPHEVKLEDAELALE